MLPVLPSSLRETEGSANVSRDWWLSASDSRDWWDSTGPSSWSPSRELSVSSPALDEERAQSGSKCVCVRVCVRVCVCVSVCERVCVSECVQVLVRVRSHKKVWLDMV